ncbi:BppU family phage baseplate upper protein [Staphylococcus lugdunensis]|uniref:BppU family phage baseplate upper protein n=1 Tax=Staphylococcus lugdunensis TaxID=28035 RepID=UPI0022650C90|nr:BppU family phage baseplate upper protein [Staphylococcus lugdunensis]MDU3707042.1 BppU family phage baseplate upper protein [Staphylococcus lugdunensis]UZW83613.1 BppU family phage baseplate upper protein [Staphylococcus lugdunensis]
MELQKVGRINLEEEAYLKPISDRGIGFYNLDKNTAQFQFVVSKDDKPLLISDKNVKGYAFFKEMNNNEKQRPTTSGVLDIDFIDPMRGLIGVTVPQWFLKNATDSRVLGEVYLSLNDVNNTGKDDTVVLGTFTFMVRDSLVNQIESDIKVEYIRMFDDLRTQLELKVQQLQEDIGSLESLVETIKQTAKDATSQINQAGAEASQNIANAQVTASNEITKLSDESLRQIDAKRDSVLTDYNLSLSTFQKLTDDSSKTFTDNVTNANQSIDDKVNQFNETLKNNGFITPSQVDSKMDALNWQKKALTSSDGRTINLYNLDLNAPESMINSSGFYYLYAASNLPENIKSNGMLFVIYTNENYMKFIFTPYNTNQLFLRTKNGANNWTAWTKFSNDIIDTGWVDLQLINGVTPGNDNSVQNGFKSAYRSITENGITRKYVRINATNIQHGQTIALLPKDFVQDMVMQPVAVPRNRYGGRVTLTPSGTVTFNVLYDSTQWTSTDYAYAQIEWTE